MGKVIELMAALAIACASIEALVQVVRAIFTHVQGTLVQ
jgi:hypothetical protein